MGDIVINDVCASHCDACPEMELNEADLVVEAFIEQMEAEFRAECLYATRNCRDKIHNVLSCGLEAPGFEALDPLIRQAILAQGTRVASKYSKLGSSSLHLRDQVIQVGRQVGLCEEMVMTGDISTGGDSSFNGKKPFDGDSSGGSSFVGWKPVGLASVAVWLGLCIL